MVPVLCCVRVRQGVSGAVRSEADERDSQNQHTHEKRHHWRIVGYIISKIGHRLPDSHHQRHINLEFEQTSLITSPALIKYDGACVS